VAAELSEVSAMPVANFLQRNRLRMPSERFSSSQSDG
jgi:hypothetical protein